MGLFITIDGPNGAGKSTFISNLLPIINNLGKIFVTKEPSNTDLGSFVKENECKISGLAYAYLIAADRAYHIEKEILPNLKERSNIVLCDRYIESSLALQRFDGVPIDSIWKLNEDFPVPDLSIVLIASEEQLCQRLSIRKKLSRFELEMERRQEIEYYKDAYTYLKQKNFNVLLLDNDEKYFKDNLSIVIDNIKKLKRELI